MKDFSNFILCVFLLSHGLSSQSCCSGGVPVSSNIGFQSTEAHITQLSISGDFNFLKTLKSGSETLNDDQRLRATHSYILRGAHSVTNRLTFEFFLPFVRQTRQIVSLLGTTDTEQTSGIGDPVVLALFKVLDRGLKVRIGIGPQIPIGAYQQTNDRGLILLEDLQPGSGAWDMIAIASLEYSLKNRPSSILYLNSIISRNGSNPNSRGGNQLYKFGNDVQLIGGFSDQVFLNNLIVSPGVSLRYRWAQRDQVDFNYLPGTGGEFIFASLSTSFPFIQISSQLNINVEWPLWSKVNDTQLAPSYRFNVGWSLTIDPTRTSTPIVEDP